MQALAPLVAKENNLTVTDYRAVMKELKKEQLPKDQVEAYYAGVIKQVEDIIRREHIVTLPERPMIMRLASEAENAAQPAPHMQPPPLINNKGERGQFVLTTGNPPAKDGAKTDGYDDFTHKSATWTLTAHEGRPGHELQFSAMVERGAGALELVQAVFGVEFADAVGVAGGVRQGLLDAVLERADVRGVGGGLVVAVLGELGDRRGAGRETGVELQAGEGGRAARGVDLVLQQAELTEEDQLADVDEAGQILLLEPVGLEGVVARLDEDFKILLHERVGLGEEALPKLVARADDGGVEALVDAGAEVGDLVVKAGDAGRGGPLGLEVVGG
ncbi:MAG: DUF885 family protein, partial [Opitutus sp.]